jgi:hypothetical protein
MAAISNQMVSVLAMIDMTKSAFVSIGFLRHAGEYPVRYAQGT